MRRKAAPLLPNALAAGILGDGERALFLVRKNIQGIETVEFPCVLLMKGENPVARLTEEFRRQTGIDGEVHEVLFEKRHNAGTRKRRVFVPALAFKVTAKSTKASPSSEFSSYKWLTREDLRGLRLSKNAEWLR